MNIIIDKKQAIWSSLKNVSGIGEKKFAILSELLNRRTRIIDLIYHKPTSIINRQYVDKITNIRHESQVICKVTISEYCFDNSKTKNFQKMNLQKNHSHYIPKPKHIITSDRKSVV